MRSRALALATGLLAIGCGARTGLGVDARSRDAGGRGMDAGRDAAVAPDADLTGPHDACVPTEVTLVAATADVVLVLDRSGSMGDVLRRGGGTRWSALRAALADVLPAYDERIAIGAELFPQPAGAAVLCDASPTPQVGLAMRHSGAVLAEMDARMPEGGTPTATAIEAAVAALRAIRAPGAVRAVVLATDGGPNCNPADSSETWYGLAPELCPRAGISIETCLDDVATIAAIERARADGIDTYVIGIDVRLPVLVDVLERMADAGGHAAAGVPRYYDVSRATDLVPALDDITGRIARCSFSSPTPIDRARLLEVRLDGAPLPYDEAGERGWRVGAGGTIELAPDPCARTTEPSSHVSALVTCE